MAGRVVRDTIITFAEGGQKEIIRPENHKHSVTAFESPKAVCTKIT